MTKKQCTVEGCSKPHNSKGYCTTHGRRVRLGLPLDTPVQKYGAVQDDLRKIESAVQTRDRSSCWTDGFRLVKGYSMFGRNLTVGHAALEFDGRPREGSANMLHSCPGGDNKACWNPDHLRWGTQAENMRDALERGQFRPREMGIKGSAVRWGK